MKKAGFVAVLLLAGLMPKYAFASGHMGGISGGGAAIIIGLFFIIPVATFMANIYAINAGFITRKKREPVAPFIAGCVNSLWLCAIGKFRGHIPVGSGILFGSLIAMNVVAFVRSLN